MEVVVMIKWMMTLLMVFLIISPHEKVVTSQPLSANSRWIVNDSGERVKLACVNWVAHLEVVVAEGLSKQPVDVISRNILELGFNCVRLTWPLFLFTDDSLASVTVRQSFLKLGLTESIAGFQANNPSILDLSLFNAYQAVVASLANHNVMIILDNHISKPGWCCSNDDGNGFFGDQYFNPDLWIKGLTKVATTFKDINNVIGMSLRNELRGPKQNINDWYRYMQKGAEAVHAANPNVLIILSGLNYDKDFSFLRQKPISLTFTGKVVFEVHWYGFSDGQDWKTGNPNQVCGQVMGNMMRRAGFLLDQGYPIFVSEFGLDLRGTNVNDNRYIDCFMGWAAEYDVDWAFWTLVGSYYLRQGVVGMNEFYGIYNWNWCEVRNSSLLQKISVLQAPFQGPLVSQSRPHKLIFHPSTGLCVLRKSFFKPLELGPCSEAEAWSYTPQQVLTIKGTYYCLQADELGQPATLGLICTDPSSKWEAISDSKMHLSSKLQDGNQVCLDVDSNNVVVTSSCKCLSKDNKCEPGSQWFKIIDSSRPTTCAEEKSTLQIKNSVIFNVVKKLAENLWSW
ncbi:OLC1v1028465C1 [Oldenlandia corymbosa var. corymbosa]|uniref:OLC1v1028465C1 n=1 Tax=Oldenlandia corymbosa var. corymbosa TaxID=529605 RepID=A0AAV1CBR8_OLDCO|nr:OLC1v1028465C1 [Oldenlandia corymbosa var. corymbosa]